MAKKPAGDPNTPERDPERRPKARTAEAGTYKTRSAASRRAEARARAAYRGTMPGMEGPEDAPEPRIAVRDVGIRVNIDAEQGVIDRDRQSQKKKAAEVEQALIVQLLHNPTKQVPVEALRAQYGYVVVDIRNMAVLAAGLFALLIVLALVLPH
ncbi:MAG: hypothetical protein JNL42_05505 [Anaerolineae bacterium]|nr:hypothetical protein [Anaerolineae bacterium]